MTTIQIRKTTGPSDSKLLAEWRDGEFIRSTEDARFVDDEDVQQMDANELLRHFDGPYVFAALDDGRAEKSFGEFLKQRDGGDE